MKLNRIVDKGMARIYVSMIRFAEQNPLKDNSFIREAKRELRKWYKREISEEQFVHSDLDSYDSIITCPEIIQSYREAYKYYLIIIIHIGCQANMIALDKRKHI